MVEFKLVTTTRADRRLGRTGRAGEGGDKGVGGKQAEISKSVKTDSHTRGYQPLPRDRRLATKLGKEESEFEGVRNL